MGEGSGKEATKPGTLPTKTSKPLRTYVDSLWRPKATETVQIEYVPEALLPTPQKPRNPCYMHPHHPTRHLHLPPAPLHPHLPPAPPHPPPAPTTRTLSTQHLHPCTSDLHLTPAPLHLPRNTYVRTYVCT